VIDGHLIVFGAAFFITGAFAEAALFVPGLVRGIALLKMSGDGV
jgi:hypothetical protein